VQGADVLSNVGRQYRWRRFSELLADPARSEIPGTHDELHAREPGDPVGRPWAFDDAPSWMVVGVADRRWTGREGNA
ncbi:MAG: hypothetical protein LC790_05340, partial [Actinobacteria bacterium]|nr:hypothetical protein [Actinomycetota bacterium]